MPTAAMVALLLVAGAAALLLPARDVVRDALRRWLFIAGAGFATIGAAYAIFIPGDFYYWPLAHGIGNRVNAAAALGFAIVIYSLIVLAALLIVRALRIRAALTTATAIAVAASVALGASFISTIHSDGRPYESAARLQRGALEVLAANVGRPAPGTTVYLFGVRGEVSPNVFTFVRPNDLTAALRLLWKDDTINGVPAASTQVDWPGNSVDDSGIACGPQGVQPHGWLFDAYAPTPYGQALFVDTRTRTSARIVDRASCTAALALLADH